MRVAIVGSGMIAAVHRRSAVLAGASVTGVLSSSRATAEAAAAQWGTAAFGSYEELLSSGADAVHICSPNATHAAYALSALAAGKHVICEKPLGVTVEQAAAMEDAAARATGLVATVPFVYRYHPVVAELRERRVRGEFGPLNLIHGSYLQDWLLDPATGGWRVRADAGGASRAFADIGSHWCDLVEWVSGERFTALTAATSIVYPERPDSASHAFAAGEPAGPRVRVVTEDIALALLRTSTGVLANVTVSQVAAGRKNRLWFELDGSSGSAAFDQEQPESAWLGGVSESRIIVRDPAHATPPARRLSSLPAGHAQGYQQCFDNFIADSYAAMRGQAPHGLPTFQDGVRTARIVEAMLRSAATGEWTDIT